MRKSIQEVFMKYRKEERLKIGQLLYEGKCTKADIMKEYDIANTSINKYLRDYLINIGKLESPSAKIKGTKIESLAEKYNLDISDYQSMSKDELIDELIKAKVEEARAKKGYIVKGGGQKKEYISLNNKSSK